MATVEFADEARAAQFEAPKTGSGRAFATTFQMRDVAEVRLRARVCSSASADRVGRVTPQLALSRGRQHLPFRTRSHRRAVGRRSADTRQLAECEPDVLGLGWHSRSSDARLTSRVRNMLLALSLCVLTAANPDTACAAMRAAVDALAAKLGPSPAITVESLNAAAWPDATLGCGVRSGSTPATPASGYRVLVALERGSARRPRCRRAGRGVPAVVHRRSSARSKRAGNLESRK